MNSGSEIKIARDQKRELKNACRKNDWGVITAKQFLSSLFVQKVFNLKANLNESSEPFWRTDGHMRSALSTETTSSYGVVMKISGRYSRRDGDKKEERSAQKEEKYF